MSINYKKISEMISEEVNNVNGIDKGQKKTVSQLCNKIYMLNANLDSVSGSRMIEDIMGEMSLAADKLKDQGVDL